MCIATTYNIVKFSVQSIDQVCDDSFLLYYITPYCHTFWVNNLIRYLEVRYNTCTTIFTYKQIIYFLQTKHEYISIIYMNQINTNYEFYINL